MKKLILILVFGFTAQANATVFDGQYTLLTPSSSECPKTLGVYFGSASVTLSCNYADLCGNYYLRNGVSQNSSAKMIAHYPGFDSSGETKATRYDYALAANTTSGWITTLQLKMSIDDGTNVHVELGRFKNGSSPWIKTQCTFRRAR